jgi:hypothetical protein
VKARPRTIATRPRRPRTDATPRRRTSEAAAAESATPPTKGADSDGATDRWVARAAWLGDTLDRPLLSDDTVWEPLIARGQPVAGNHEPLAKAILAQLADPKAAGGAAAKRIRVVQASFTRPPFFREKSGVVLVHVAGQGARPDTRRYDAAFSAVLDPGTKQWKVTSFNFKSPVLHELNLKAPLVAERHPLAYVRYFMYIVRGPQGPFRLVDEPRKGWPFSPNTLKKAKTSDQAAGARLGEKLHTPRFDGIDYAGRLRYKVCLLYAGNLFGADLALDHGGVIEMVSDRTIAEVPALKE